MMSIPSHGLAAAATRTLALAALVTGCAGVTPATETKAPGLTGTAWQLASFEGAQAGSAPLRPSRPDQFRLQFDAGGRLLARIDCNQGSGSWQSPADSGAAGSLRIGALATTKMMCPPGPFSGRLPGDLQSVRRYSIDGDRLRLEGDAGVYLWERAALAKP